MRYSTLILLLIIASNSLAQLTVYQIIDKHYKSCKTNVLINDLTEFEAQAYLFQNYSDIPMSVKGKMPDMFRTDLKISNLNIVKISKGGQTIQYNPFNDSTIVSKSSKSPLMEFVKGWVATIDTNNCTKVELIGEDKIEDIEVYQIKIDVGEYSSTYFVDKLSFLVLRIDNNNGKTTLYQDFRQLEQYVVPYKFIVYNNDSPNITMQFETINLHPNLDKSDFEN